MNIKQRVLGGQLHGATMKISIKRFLLFYGLSALVFFTFEKNNLIKYYDTNKFI